MSVCVLVFEDEEWKSVCLMHNFYHMNHLNKSLWDPLENILLQMISVLDLKAKGIFEQSDDKGKFWNVLLPFGFVSEER